MLMMMMKDPGIRPDRKQFNCPGTRTTVEQRSARNRSLPLSLSRRHRRCRNGKDSESLKLPSTARCG